MRIYSIGAIRHVDVDSNSIEDIKSFLSQRIGFGSETLLLLSGGKDVICLEDIEDNERITAMFSHRSALSSEETIQISFPKAKIEVPLYQSVADLKEAAYATGISKVPPKRQRMVINGKVIPDYMMIVDVSLFVGSKKLSVSVTSTPDEIVETFNKDSLASRLQKLPKRKDIGVTDQYKGLKRSKTLRKSRLMPTRMDEESFLSPTKAVATSTPVKAQG